MRQQQPDIYDYIVAIIAIAYILWAFYKII